MGGRGKSLSVWVRLGTAKRLHAKEVLHDALSPVAHGGIGKSLRVWVGLGRVDRPHVKSGTYYASVFRFWPIYGGMMSWWHFYLCGTLGEIFGFEIVLDIFYGSQWIKYSFIVILGSLVLYYFYNSCRVVNEIDFA